MRSAKDWTWEGFWERAISAFKYFMAVALMLNGLTTAIFGEVDDGTVALGWIYQSHTVLAIFGIIIFLCGLTLFIGKILKRRNLTGQGLMAVFCCYLFATVLQYIAYAGDPSAWVVNAIFAVAMGLLYLRWRFKTAYIDPNHFRDDVEKLRYEAHEHNRLAP